VKKWEKKEKKDAKDFGGYRVAGSGNQWYAPGDVKHEVYLIDSKQTDKKSYSISLQTWDKLYEEALFSKRLPILSLQIQNLELVVLAKDDFLSLTTKKES
jgi:hypothetical protein